MTNNGIVKIHGKEYMTVAGRIDLAGKDFLGSTTEVLSHSPVVVKVTVLTTKGRFEGISAANPEKVIEKQSPYEVAETSALGRALGFAGYGIVEGIATADEIKKSEESIPYPTEEWIEQNRWSDERLSKKPIVTPEETICKNCGKAKMVLNPKTGKFFCEDKCWLNKS